MLCLTLAFMLAGLSVLRFVRHSILLTPLLIVLALNVVGAVLSLASGQRRRRHSADGHARKVADWNPAHLPSVDVYLPTCGEPLAILDNTYRHVIDMQWDGPLNVYVLDDGDRLEVAMLAEIYGFHYVVRPDRGHMKKAGNMAHAFARTDGELIVILDADFCPRRDFLAHLVPYLDDPSVGIVQSPQVFDTAPEMSWLQRTAGATQELFYRWVQPSRDRAGAPICVGTNAVYRRSALDAIGGFALIDHSEDIHTGIGLMRAGYSTCYVPIQVAKGLCPDDLTGFMNQQYRWCNGSLTRFSTGVTQPHRLTLAQRLCFWAGFMYYVTTAVNVFAIYVPSVVMAVAYPRDIRPLHFLPFLFGVWVYLVLLPRVSRTRWRFEVLRVQMVYSFSHAVAIADKLRRRSADWVPTGSLAKRNPLARRIAALGFTWLASMTILSWAAMLWDVARYGLANLWPLSIFFAGFTYLGAPLLVAFGRILRAERTRSRVRPSVNAGTLS